MKAKKTLVLVLAAVFCLAMIATACSGSGGSSGSSAPAASSDSSASSGGDTASTGGGDASGGTVYWLNGKPESDGALQAVAAMYKTEKGVDVKVVTAAAGTYEQTLASEMDKSAPPTMFTIGTTEGAKKWNDYALDLKGSPIEAELNTDAYNLYGPDGKLVSVGYCYEAFGIIANPDLISKAGYKVEDINNFAKLKEVVEDIHARKDELGFDAFTSNDMDSSSSWRITAHLINTAYYYEQADNHWTETPPEITGDYMDKFKNIYDLAINNSTVLPTELATGGHDAVNEYNTGAAAFMIQGSWTWPQVMEKQPNSVMIPYYCGADGEENAGLNCGTEQRWAINSKASEADQKATMDFMVWCVTNPEANAVLVESYGVMPYKQSAASTNNFLAQADKYTADGKYVMNWAFNFQPNVEQYRQALVSALNQYNTNQNDSTWDTVKTATVQGWAQQYKAANG